MRRFFTILRIFLALMLLFCITVLADSSCTNHNYVLVSQGNYSLEQISVSSDGHLCRHYTYWYCTTGDHMSYLPANDPLYPDQLIAHNYTVRSTDLGHVGTDMHAYVFTCSKSYSGISCNYTKTIEIPCTGDCVHYVNKKPPVTEVE